MALRIYPFAVFLLVIAAATGARAQTDSTLRDAIDAHKIFVTEERCKQVSDAQMLLLRSDQDEKRALLAGTKPELLPQLDKANASWEEVSLKIDCLRDPLLLFSRQTLSTRRSTAYVYASIVLDLQRTRPYAADLTTLGERADAIHRVMADIESRTNLGLAIPGISAQMANTLLDLCQERKNIRWKNGERPCPVPTVEKAEVAYGAMILRDIEAFIAADDIAPPPAKPSQWTGTVSGDSCQIGTKVGATSLNGKTDKASRIGFFEFSTVTDIPASSIRLKQGAVQEPARLTLEGYTSINGLPALQFKKLHLSLPQTGRAAINPGSPGPDLILGKLKISTRYAADGLEADARSPAHSVLPGNAAMEPEFFLLVGLLDESRLHLDGTEPGPGFEIDADLSDLARVLKATPTLHQATVQCWP